MFVCRVCAWVVDVVWCGVMMLFCVVSMCLLLCSGWVCLVWKCLCDVVCGVVGCVACGSFV